MKQNILEYYNGNPDNVYDSSTDTDYNWRDDDTLAFGFFQVDLDGNYEFLYHDISNHYYLATVAVNKIIGRAAGHVSEEYISDWMISECYSRSYGKGRIWKNEKIISFWAVPSYNVLETVVSVLKLNPKEYIVVEANETLEELMDDILEGNNGNYESIFTEGYEEEGEKCKIDPKVADIIRSYNQPSETWQSKKEKEGWKSLAQRNAALYQENRERIDEYYSGDPDTIEEIDDETGEYLSSIRYKDKNVISFGFFQTTLDGGKEFIYKTDICHHDICKELAENIIGKAMASEDIEDFEIKDVATSIYSCAAYKGRIFLDANVFTTWNRVSSTTLENLLNLMGGVEKWKDLVYVVPKFYDSNWDEDELSQKNINVVEYIAQGITADEGREKRQMTRDFKGLVDEWIIDTIREYNRPNSTLAAKTAKLGNMTIAQYNSLIHQEEKEPKQTIKENNINMKNNKYQEEFSNYLNIMSEALKKDDYKAYEYVKTMLDEAIEDSKHEKELMNEMNTTNFGVLNHIFENELPTLIKTNKKAVKKVINTIKEDKNLLGQFNFYNVIKEQYNGKVAETLDSKTALDHIAKIVCEEIDTKTIKASNNKLKKVMIECGVRPTDFVDEDSMKLYENGNIILSNKRTTSNALNLIESYDAVSKWMDAHKEDKKVGQDADEMIREFEEKLKNNLNESEMSFVQQITDWRSPLAEQRKEKLFNKFKNECIEKINSMLKEDANNVELKGLSDQLSEMKFDKNNIVKDIAKLLEIRDILMDD